MNDADTPMQMAPDNRTLTLRIAADLSAAQVEALISDLCARRAEMFPAVSHEPPNQQYPGGSERVMVQDEPTIAARLLRDGRIRLWIQNRGFGWMALNLLAVQAAALRDFLILNTPQDDTYPSLFRDDRGDRSTH